jgi:[protein-PII] uridylyltransferase
MSEKNPFIESLRQIKSHAASLPNASIEEVRAMCVGTIRPTWETARESLKKEFLELGRAPTLIRAMSKSVDGIIACLFDCAKQALKLDRSEIIAVLAYGGYGRRELYPASDIDIGILYDKTSEKHATLIASFITYSLWDLGFTVGQSLRTVNETLDACKSDVTICTSLLDARYVAGSKSLFEAFDKQYWEQIQSSSAMDFVEAKLAERDERHKKVGDSRYVLEPNLKEGKGGLRDLHTLYWLARYIYKIESLSQLVELEILTKEELSAFNRAEHFLMEVRCHLHYLAGRPEERLTFDMQRSVAEKMGFEDDKLSRAVERFMKRYFQTVRTVGNLTRSVCAVLEDTKKRKPKRITSDASKMLNGFVVEGTRLNIENAKFLKDDPVRMIEIFHLAQQQELDIHPHAWQLISRHLDLVDTLLKNAKAHTIFLDILLSKHNPDLTLRRMNESGVMGRFIPDFGNVIGQMQFDMYHVYTVDEHTINAIGILHSIDTGTCDHELPLATKIFPLIKMRRALFLALLCHDISKGQGGDHSVLGEGVVRKLTKRFGCSQDEIETAAWLVRHHLLMSHTAFKRDVNDPKTVQDFVAAVQSPERLRLLLVLTVADIRAVGPTIWNGWKGSLLRELYYKAEALMGASDIGDEKRRIQQLEEDLKTSLSGWSLEEVRAYLDLGSSSFWSSMDIATHTRIAHMVKQIPTLAFPLTMDTRVDSFRAITELTICTPDQHGLFSKMSGALALSGVNIMGAKIFTLKNGMAVEVFQVQDAEGKAFDKPSQLARLAVIIEQVLTDEISLSEEMSKTRTSYPSRLDVFKVPPRVFIENKVSTNHTVIEVGGRDRIGFLYTVTHILSEMGLTISTAHISTYGERAVDVFYVKDVFGLKINHEGKIREIRERIIEALSQTPEKLKKTG